MKYIRSIQLAMAGGAILVIASAFLPFAASVMRLGPAFRFFAVYPFQVWWFGYPLIAIGAVMLLSLVFHPSHRRFMVHTIVGILLSVVAVVAIPLFILAKNLTPLPFLPMLVGGLLLATGGIWMVRRERY